MVLNKEHHKAIELLVNGSRPVDVAKEIGKSRSTIYAWMEDKEFKAELDKQRKKISDTALNKVRYKVGNYLESIEAIANTSDNESIKLQAYGMLLDRALGKATSKQDISVTNNDSVNEEINLDELLDTADNVINIDKIAK